MVKFFTLLFYLGLGFSRGLYSPQLIKKCSCWREDCIISRQSKPKGSWCIGWIRQSCLHSPTLLYCRYGRYVHHIYVHGCPLYLHSRYCLRDDCALSITRQCLPTRLPRGQKRRRTNRHLLSNNHIFHNHLVSSCCLRSHSFFGSFPAVMAPEPILGMRFYCLFQFLG